MTGGQGDTLKLSDATADRVTAFHHRAASLIDGIGGKPSTGAEAVGDGADHIDAIVTRLAEGVDSIARRHGALGYSAQVNAHGVNSLDEGVSDAFDDMRGA